MTHWGAVGSGRPWVTTPITTRWFPDPKSTWIHWFTSFVAADQAPVRKHNKIYMIWNTKNIFIWRRDRILIWNQTGPTGLNCLKPPNSSTHQRTKLSNHVNNLKHPISLRLEIYCRYICMNYLWTHSHRAVHRCMNCRLRDTRIRSDPTQSMTSRSCPANASRLDRRWGGASRCMWNLWSIWNKMVLVYMDDNAKRRK